MEMREKFCIIFKKDSLDAEGIRHALNRINDAKVCEEEDTTLEYVNDQNETVSEDVHVFYMEGPILSHLSVKIWFNCFDLSGNPAYGNNGRYYLFPR